MRTVRGKAGEGASRYFINSIAKAFQVLEAFSKEQGSLTLTELSERSRQNKATVRRIALTLCDLGYLQLDQKRRFSPTPKVLDLSALFLESLSLPQVTEPYLSELAERTHESANLAIRDGSEVLYVVRVSAARRILAVNLHVGSRLPLHATSLGKALLLGANRQDLVEILGPPPWPQYTPSTRTDPDQLLADLEEARKLGCALADGELEAGLRSVAAPIRDSTGSIIAAANVSTHSLQVSLDQLLGPIRQNLLETADAVSRALGYRG
ncbi:MAG: helix-turn-helix domain-containing protein [Thermaerobacter sp.]|nr:helix-turn-helix domain-containing protein [Thermaerobacter sp.]